jgi:hypothetical protein
VTASTTTLAPAALNVLRDNAGRAAQLLSCLPGEVIDAPGSEGWSPHDVVAHLASLTGPTFVDRVTLMLEHDDPDVPGIDEQDVLDRSGLRDKPLAALLDQFGAERARAVEWAETITAEQLRRAGQHQVVGELTVAEVIHHKAWHDLLHVRQVTALIAVPLDEGRGGMPVFT